MIIKETCKVNWCSKQIEGFDSRIKFCLKHKNPPKNSSTRPWLHYKRERILDNKLECESCGDNYPQKFPNVDIKILSSLMDVDHIDSSIKGTIKGEQPINYQLLCKICHAIKSHDEDDYNSHKNQ